MPNEMQNLITVREVAERTGKDASTVSRWIKAGKFKAEKVHPESIRSPYLIDRASLEQFLARDAKAAS